MWVMKKDTRREGHLDINIEAIHTAAFKEGHILGAANEKWAWETVGHDLNNLDCAWPKLPLMFEVGV